MGLSPEPVPPGSLTAYKTHPTGGVFDSTIYVQPLFTFTSVADPSRGLSRLTSQHTERQARNREQTIARELEQVLDPLEPPERGPRPGSEGPRRRPGRERRRGVHWNVASRPGGIRLCTRVSFACPCHPPQKTETTVPS